ncbi:MAG: L-threonylcarbamoyladenylate synthase [Hyphomicrobiaceae bacterium]
MTIRSPSCEAVAEAASLLRAGRLVAIPTETVYGLAADATDGLAVAAIFAAKGRPSFNPLIVHVADLAAADRLGVLGHVAELLARSFWPGPLTLVVPRRPDCAVAELATAGLTTIALRMPAHPVALAVIRAAGRPLAAPSANRSGHVSPTTAAHVAADLAGQVALVLDGGNCAVGLESTVVAPYADRLVLLRPGAVTRDMLAAATGLPVLAAGEGDADRPASPGRLLAHYQPVAAVRLAASAPRPDEAFLAFGPDAPAHDGPSLNLSRSGDLGEAAAALFGALRALDRPGITAIAVMPIPDHGLGEAINDRLARAAAPR